MQIRQILQTASQQLTATSGSARLDAELLLAACLGKTRSYLFAWPEHEPDVRQLHHFRQLLEQRLQGQPVAYLLGKREFWGLELKVSPATLIPRPDTERLVELALEQIPNEQPCRVLDLGTGSGAIALAIASERKLAEIWAIDSSSAVLEIARENAATLRLKQVHCLQSDWFTALPAHLVFDLIVSNPPYIAAGDPHLAQGDVRFEPDTALCSGPDGLDAIRQLITQAPTHLRPQGWLMLEHGYDQGLAVTSLLKQAGFQNVTCHQDLAGLDRASIGQRPA